MKTIGSVLCTLANMGSRANVLRPTKARDKGVCCLGGHSVMACELTEVDLVSPFPEIRNDYLACADDGEHDILIAVRHENLRTPDSSSRRLIGATTSGREVTRQLCAFCAADDIRKLPSQARLL